jgi:hypothetical protein
VINAGVKLKLTYVANVIESRAEYEITGPSSHDARFSSRSPGQFATPIPLSDIAAAFRKGLGETGYVEGQNVAVEYHWLEGQ